MAAAAIQNRELGQNVMVWVDKQDGKEYRLSFEHAKLLYLVSFYGKSSRNAEELETWLRELHLHVLIYEGILAGKLDFDYAPSSRQFSYVKDGKSHMKRQFLNISQEGISAIDDLREQSFLYGLKLTNTDDITSTAVQVSHKGAELLTQLSPMLKLEVEEFLYHRRRFSKSPHPRKDLKHVLVTPTNILIVTLHGYEHPSTVTEAEDISYVTSPFLPWLLRRGETPMTDNADRAWESAQGLSQVKTEMQESIVLTQVSVLISEWLPIGPNQLSILLNRMGAGRRYAGGLMTSAVDTSPEDSLLSTFPGMTAVKFLDYSTLDAVNFEAEIIYPEEEGIRQVEHLGIHISMDGTVYYGARVEAILERLADDISLDLLCRMLVDIEQDSSVILNDLVTPTQRSILNLVFREHPGDRSKFKIIFSEKTEPALPAASYMDHGEYENELKQILGPIRQSFDLGKRGEVVVLGEWGALIIGHTLRKFDRVIISYASSVSMGQFIDVLFRRVMKTVQDLGYLKALCLRAHTSPLTAQQARSMQQHLATEMGLLNQALEAILDNVTEIHLPPIPSDEIGKTLYTVLNVTGRVKTLKSRAHDLKKLVRGCSGTFHALAPILKSLQVLDDAQEGTMMTAAFGRLVEVAKSSTHEAQSYRVLGMLFAAWFALILFDALISARATQFKILLPPASYSDSNSSTSSGLSNFDVMSAINITASLNTSVGLNDVASSWPLLIWVVTLDNIPIFNLLLHSIFLVIGVYVLSKLLIGRVKPTRTVKYVVDMRVNLDKLRGYVSKLRGKEERFVSMRGDYVHEYVDTYMYMKSELHMLKEKNKSASLFRRRHKTPLGHEHGVYDYDHEYGHVGHQHDHGGHMANMTGVRAIINESSTHMDNVHVIFTYGESGGRLRWGGPAPQIAVGVDIKNNMISSVIMTRHEYSRFSWIKRMPFYGLIKRVALKPLEIILRPFRHVLRRWIPAMDALRMTGDVDEEMLQTLIVGLKKHGVFDMTAVPEIRDKYKMVKRTEENKDKNLEDVNPPGDGGAGEEEEEPNMDDDLGSETLEQVQDEALYAEKGRRKKN
jgi:hypothetical protein